MDDRTFDTVTRAISAGASRRQALRVLAIGAVTAWLPRQVVAVPARQECGEGLTYCEGSGVCTGLVDDAYNCGACGNVCASGVCDGGVCIEVGCAEGLADCAGSGVCTSLIDDPNNCGACGTVCPSGVCDGGTCTQPGCGEGLTYCEGSGVCTGLVDDAYNCGACGNVCASGVCEGGICSEVGCAAGLTYCEAFGACYDLASDATHCGACDVTCASGDAVAMECVDGVCVATGCVSPLVDCAGECIDLSVDPNNCGACGTVCESGVCTGGVCAEPTPATPAATSTTTPATPEATSTTTPATPAAPTPTSTPPTDGGSTGSNRQRRNRSQGTGSGSSSSGTRSGSAKPAKVKEPKVKQAAEGPAPLLAWPFDPEAGQWTIVNGYRGEDQHAPPTSGGQNYAVFAFDFGVCRPENVDVADGTCELGPASGSGADAGKPGWDTAATRGANVLSPVDGTVAWTEEVNATCLSIGIDIKGHPGYRLALFNVEGHPERGETVKQGKRIGKVAKEGCEEGDRLHMVLYRPQAGASDDPEEEREGVPFADEWAIAGCDYPDDKKTANQYRGDLVPCNPEDATAGGA